MATVQVQVDLGEDSDELELHQAMQQLREELLRLDVQRIEPATLSRRSSPGVRGPAVDTATLLIDLANSAVLVTVCQAVGGWLSRRERRGKAVIAIGDRRLEIDNVDAKETARIIDNFFAVTEAVPVANGADASSGADGTAPATGRAVDSAARPAAAPKGSRVAGRLTRVFGRRRG